MSKNKPQDQTTVIGDRVIWRRELQEAMSVKSDTIRRWILAKKLPEPDVKISQKTLGWRLSTLQNAGIYL